MKITIITLFPKMIHGFLNESIIGRAQKDLRINIEVVDLRDFGEGGHKTVDDRPYGGGAGMVLMAKPILSAIKQNRTNKSHVILTSAKGHRYDQDKAEQLSTYKDLVILCGHYEGVDERVMNYVDEEISIGDFVMTGGEIAACAIVDSVVRLISGVLKKEEATEEESFYKVSIKDLLKLMPNDIDLKNLNKRGVKSLKLIEYPHYTRPVIFGKQEVPEVLLSGNHSEINSWRVRQAYLQTKNKRPDLLR